MVDRGRGRDLQPSRTGAGQRLQRALGRDLVDQEARAGLLDQGQVALQLDALGDGGRARQAQPRGQFAGGGHRAFRQPWLGRAAGDQGVEGGGVSHDPLQGAGVANHPVAVGEIQGARLVHQADLGHALAVARLRRRPRCADVHQIERRAAPLDVVDQGGIVDCRVGVGLDDDGGDAARRRRQAGRLQRLLGFVARLAGLDPDVDQAGRQAAALGVDDLHALGALGGLAVDDLDDAAVLDQDRAGAVIVAGRVQQAGVDDGQSLGGERLSGGHAAPPARRWARAARTAMRAATPIST
ncbi:hypothetical protein D3C80_1083460 [compost metagenome]